MTRPALFLLVTSLALACSDGSRELPMTDQPAPEMRLPWGLADVSVLFPIGPDQTPHLLQTTNELDGDTHVMLPETLFAKLGTDVQFLTEGPGRDQHYDKLRLTALRLDPCVDGFELGAEDCKPALRLVMQPAWLVNEEDSVYSIFDASVHLFYELAPAQWQAFVAAYDALRTDDLSAAPLTVHPVLAEQGMAGDFGVALNELLVRTATADRLTRMTFMATGRSGNNWFWGGFDKTEAGFVPSAIPGVEHGGDAFHQHGRGTPNPPPVLGEGGFPQAMLYDKTLDALEGDAVTEGLRFLYSMENPRLENAATIRCAACHLAAQTRPYVLGRLALEEPSVAERYSAKGFDTKPLEAGENRGFNMHAFSYFRDLPTVTPRVIHESIEVVKYLREVAR